MKLICFENIIWSSIPKEKTQALASRNEKKRRPKEGLRLKFVTLEATPIGSITSWLMKHRHARLDQASPLTTALCSERKARLHPSKGEARALTSITVPAACR